VSADGFDPIAFLAEAVRRPSHEQVGPMREFLVETLAGAGVETRVDRAGNVLASRGDGASDAGHVLLNTHVDTVPPGVPFERDREAGVIRGRGACDAKGPLAAMVAAFLSVDPGDGRLTLAVTPDEERLSTGAAALVSGDGRLPGAEGEPSSAGRPSPLEDVDAVIVGEPTGLDVCTAAKGRFEGTIELSGANAHAAEPESGVNAIGALEAVLAALGTFDDRDGAPPAHPELGAATLTPTVVDGGTATNQVPADCRLTVDRRSVPPETAAGFRETLLEHLRGAVPEPVGVGFEFTDRPTPFLEPWATDPDAAVVDALVGSSGGEVRPFTAATEASYFAAHAPTVVFGPGVLADAEGAVAHSPREYVRTEDVTTAADALAAALSALVGR